MSYCEEKGKRYWEY